MDKNQFINVLHHFSDSSVEEAREILSLQADFPYSQMLHVLAARVSKDHGFSNHQQELQLAAVYASDRGVLRDIMTREVDEFDTETSVAETPTAVAVIATEPVVVSNDVQEPVYSGDVADEVIHDLDRLHELKHNFEMLFIDIQQATANSNAEQQAQAVVEVSKPVEEAKPKESGKSRKERIVEMARAMAATESTVSMSTEEIKPGRKKKEVGDTLIEEIKSTKKELEPSGEKLKEQLNIIDQFIKTQPSIANTKEKLATAPIGDLSSIKSGEFSDNIVSETLVEILVQQGKKDKAVEVLKKLIWKFPQKKAYFAAQIEELKK